MLTHLLPAVEPGNSLIGQRVLLAVEVGRLNIWSQPI